MDNHDDMNLDYDPNMLSDWLDKHPHDALNRVVSNVRTAIEVLQVLGMEDMVVSSDTEIMFDTNPPMKIEQLLGKYARHGLAVHQLVIVAYRYWKSPDNRDGLQTSEDFEFQIIVTDNFDATDFALKYQSLPPLSMMLAISKGIVEHSNEMDFCLKLLAKSEKRDSIYFTRNEKTYPISELIDALINDNQKITRIAQTGIAYVNKKSGT